MTSAKMQALQKELRALRDRRDWDGCDRLEAAMKKLEEEETALPISKIDGKPDNIISEDELKSLQTGHVQRIGPFYPFGKDMPSMPETMWTDERCKRVYENHIALSSADARGAVNEILRLREKNRELCNLIKDGCAGTLGCEDCIGDGDKCVRYKEWEMLDEK